MRIRLSEACGDALSKTRQPVITRYQLLLLIARIARQGSYQGASIYALKPEPTDADYRRVINQLVEEHKVTRDPNFPATVFAVNNLAIPSPADVCCLADPYCYVSHLSAMAHHGLTNRIPDALTLTRPAPALWNRMAEQTLERDLADLGGATKGFSKLRLRHYGFPDVVRKRPIIVHNTKYLGRSVSERDSFTRIAHVDQAFCDMLAEPNYCGGMSHVLEVWRDHASHYLDGIIHNIDELDSPMVKVRAGYIISELLHVANPTVIGWRRFAQRGGSRRLDPTRPYAPVYSEVWMISLNTEIPEFA